MKNFGRFNKGIIVLFVLGLARGSVITHGGPKDFQMAGNDTFAALIGSIALNNCCSCNGTSLVIFMIWATFSSVFCNLLFSLAPNILNASEYQGPMNLFIIDNLLLIASSSLQLYLVWLAKQILSEGAPNWQNDVVYGPSYGGGGQVSLTQPFMPQPQQQRTLGNAWGQSQAPQPASDSFRAFRGSGQTLGSSQPGSSSQDGSKKSRLLPV